MPDPPEQPPPPPRPPSDAPPPQEKKKYVLDFDPAVVGYRTTEERKADAKPRRKIKWGKVLGTSALGALLLVVVVAGIATLTLPGCLKRRCIEEAASRGVALTIEDVHLGAGRFSLVNVTATAAELPGVTAKTAEVEVEMGGFEASLITARNAEVTIDGPYESVKEAFAKWRASHGGTLPGAAKAGGSSARFVLEGAHLAWTRPFGAHVKLDVLEMRAELGRKGVDDEVHVVSPHVLLTVDGGTVGPWRISLDRQGAESRARLSFDPQLPDGPSALFVTSGERITALDVTIARTQLITVGIAPELLGLPPGGSTQIETNIHFAHPMPSRAEARATLGLYGLKIASVPTPLDAKLEFQIAGDPVAGAEVKKGSLAVGPLAGAVVGTLKVFDDGVRIDLGWSAGPLPCSAFAVPALPTVPGTPPAPLGDLGNQLRQLAQATGIAKVTGEVRMAGSFTFDSRDFGNAKVTFSPSNTCDVSLFGQK